MGSSHDIQVLMGEVRIGRGEDVLRAILGSCVGIGLLWRARGLYGLAHCLLPEAPTPTLAIGAKYVTQAVPSLLALMKADGARRGEIEAVIAGGGNMMPHQPPARHGLIGVANARMAQALIAATGIPIIHVEVGGEVGRQLTIDCAHHAFHVRAIGSNGSAAVPRRPALRLVEGES
ncbi:chemotaxis protein CheD [Pandoraea pnomenusa]|jgi:chemotaxis protein CheD|uniref:Probable chemoreceptor glutamine deamidase CheD n=1 Tax=Pandoraea pnomenusa TaxID=93220 RepID=A0ABY6WIT9_9BURK|nr:chemotaxis protein CheD [Pandoraea pnomenusa]MBN9095598.1 chemotaxis protein CheD [Pandoraea pnomenusa]QDH61549.1 chemotaxis protein CheD [Pandoraea pnomenusa]QDX23542.1 chemotaxis protein CheD [Pandoraea pnomenusa]VVE65827.1 Chemoreceptor glutamine deamidase CheD [Pandoraea pnomenusa]